MSRKIEKSQLSIIWRQRCEKFSCKGRLMSFCLLLRHSENYIFHLWHQIFFPVYVFVIKMNVFSLIPLITSILSKVNKSNINWKTKPLTFCCGRLKIACKQKIITILLVFVCSTLQYVTHVFNFSFDKVTCSTFLRGALSIAWWKTTKMCINLIFRKHI